VIFSLVTQATHGIAARMDGDNLLWLATPAHRILCTRGGMALARRRKEQLLPSRIASPPAIDPYLYSLRCCRRGRLTRSGLFGAFGGEKKTVVRWYCLFSFMQSGLHAF